MAAESGTPKWTSAMMDKEERFPQARGSDNFKVMVPVSYEGIDSVTSISRNRSQIMPSKMSSKLEAHKPRETLLIRGDLSDAYQSPGPAAYAQSCLTQHILAQGPLLKADRFKVTHKVYFKEWRKDLLEQTPIGPGDYNLEPQAESVL